MPRRKLIYIYLLIIGLTLAVIIYRDKQVEKANLLNSLISNFEECRLANYPVSEEGGLKKCLTPDGRVFLQKSQANEAKKEPATYKDFLIVEQPLGDSVIDSPVFISGKARGNWFFEAVLPVYLENQEGVTIATGYVEALDEWMSEEFVPFSGELTFIHDKTEDGFLIFGKNNPSALSEFDDSFALPVVIKQSSSLIPLTVFFITEQEEGEEAFECSDVKAVNKQAKLQGSLAETSLKTLLLGPDTAELNAGYSSIIPKGVKLNYLNILEDGRAEADFSEELNTLAGSCAVLAARAQIEKTLLQFPHITSVTISINGDVETALQP